MRKIALGLFAALSLGAYTFVMFTPHKPMLEVGACYDLMVPSTTDKDDDPYSGSAFHQLGQFRIHKIFDWKGKTYYAIQMITTKWTGGKADQVPLYPKSNTYGYSRIDIFDKYIGVNSGRFWAMQPDKNTVKCKPMTDAERDASPDVHYPLWEQ